MRRKSYGVIAGLFAAAGIGMWWWRTRAAAFSSATDEHGRVIFDNTPRASSPDGTI